MITEIAHQERTDTGDPFTPGPKEPVARLLDLTQGWAAFVEDQEGRCGDLITSDDLQSLYQDAAQLTQVTDPAA